MKPGLARRLAWIVGSNVLFGAGVGLCIALAATSFTWEQVLRSMVLGALYCNLAGVPIHLAFAYFGPRLGSYPPLWQWLVPLIIVMGTAVVVSLIAGLMFVHWFGADADEFWHIVWYGGRVCMIIGILATTAAVVYQQLRGRATASQRLAEEANNLAVRAQLASLESRVRPHFLFNTLNSVMALISDDPERAETMLQRFAGLLRFSLDAEQRGLVPLEEELDISRDYLDIEAVRLGERLRYTVDVPDDVGGARVPPFAALQAFEVNSIDYLLKPIDRAKLARARDGYASSRIDWGSSTSPQGS